MRRRAIAGLFALALALVSGSGLALAGGWAVTTMEGVPDDIVAGQTYTVGYTILQHGSHPADVEETYIQITSLATGEEILFRGESTGETGKYTAEVTFPEEGAWQWGVIQGWFGMQELGTIQAQGPASASIWTSSATRVGLTIAAVLAVGLLCVQGVWLRRERREASGPLAPAHVPISGD
jgi:hypothetical protein